MSSSKGINIVHWGYRIKAPKIAKGKTFSFGGFTSPRISAGNYKAVINKGKDIFEKEFEVSYDNSSGLNASDREFQFNTVMKMYNMTQDLAYMVYEIDEITESESVSKRFKERITKLKESLVITTGDNYVGMAKRQLREKMADLYAKIATSYDKPSDNEIDNLMLIEDEFNNDQSRIDQKSFKKN